MSPTRSLSMAFVTILIAAACSEESATWVPAAELEVPSDLLLTFPSVTRETFIQGEVIEVGDPSRPAGAYSEGGDVLRDEAFSEIVGASTKVGFDSDYAYSMAQQRYTGNVGRVHTTATVSYDGTQIGSQVAFREHYVPFLFDFGAIKDLWVEAFVFIDKECGLKVDGHSEHYARWQWFLGGPAPEWGTAGETTQAFPPVNQAACPSEEEPDNGWTGGGESGTGEESGAVTCWYWVTYDPYTGEVYDAQFLYCDDVTVGG
ncbi:MAG: hypothetical protein OEO79_10155 [Gemmatimonadota bacterium]|nr:hypothetical protein [Gemmatimonadota bacterium]